MTRNIVWLLLYKFYEIRHRLVFVVQIAGSNRGKQNFLGRGQALINDAHGTAVEISLVLANQQIRPKSRNQHANEPENALNQMEAENAKQNLVSTSRAGT